MTLSIYTDQFDKKDELGFHGNVFLEGDEHNQGISFQDLNSALIYLESAGIYVDKIIFNYSRNGEYFFQRFEASPKI